MSNLKPVEILRGHTSAETAFVVDDYPYGFRLRCKIRYWLETTKNGTRFVSQTTDPRRAVETWNKPRASTYVKGFAVMFRDEAGHVHWTGIRDFVDWPEHIQQFRDDFKALFLSEEIATVARIEQNCRRLSPTTWAEWDAKKS